MLKEIRIFTEENVDTLTSFGIGNVLINYNFER